MRRNSIWLARLLTAGLAAMALAPGAVRAQDPDAGIVFARSPLRAQFDDAPVDPAPSALRDQLEHLRADLATITVRAQLDDARADPMIPIPLGHDRMENGGLFFKGGYAMYRQTNPLVHQVIALRGFVDVDGSITGVQGQFVGSHRPALDVADAGGPGTYTPGFTIGGGVRFADGSSVEVNFMHLFDTHYTHTATLIPPAFNLGQNLADSFLFAPVFGFPNA